MKRWRLPIRARWILLAAAAGWGMAAFPRDVNASPATIAPQAAGSVILGRPTPSSIMVSLLLPADAKAVLVCGTDARALPAEGRVVSLKAGEPQMVGLDRLEPDTRYFYELRDAATFLRLLPAAATGSFHTARPPGSTFTFTLAADSHLDGNTDPALYRLTLANARTDAPDFHLDLGDTFMTEKLPSRDEALRQYLAQRDDLGGLCHSVPLFLVLGNHDGESPRGRDGDADRLAAWANAMRKRYFPNPVPDRFYSGDAWKQPDAGLLQDYYAWEWGNALFVVLDPYWFPAGGRGQRGNWKRSLGPEQYAWLKHTLENSRAAFKFVFIHQLVGGLGDQGRGGAEAASFFEWGGENPDGTDGFALHRPGWTAPIHRLLAQNRVTAVFHGHDHLYARQELDGVVYQAVPQPGDPRGTTRSAAEYGYRNGVIIGSSGHLRVTVSPTRAVVDYVRTTGSTAYSYSLSPRP